MQYKDLYYEFYSGSLKSDVKFIFLHGWGHSLLNMKSVADEFYDCDRYLVDLPGFGKSKEPAVPFNLDDYVDLIAEFIKSNISSDNKVYLVGHSFGGRIAVKLFYLYPDLINKIFIVSGAGFKARRSFFKSVIINLYSVLYKLFGDNLKNTMSYKLYYNKFASDDYKNSSDIMKKILKNIVGEDLGNVAAKIKKSAVLIYGENDNVTPPSFGRRYNKLIKNSKLYILPIFDHNTILTDGRYQVVSIIRNNIEV